LELYRLAAGV